VQTASTHRGNLTIRAATVDDLAAVVHLRGQCFKTSHWQTDEQRVDYMRRVFFENPWRDARIDPVVCIDNDEIAGFVGIIPRPMRFGDRDISGAVLSQLMVSPQHRRKGIAQALLRTAFDGPQDLTYSDIPEPATERVWVAAGGVSVPMYKFFWEISLRPFALAATHLGMSLPARALRKVSQPIFGLLDRTVAMRRSPDAGRYSAQPLTPGEVVRDVPHLVQADLLHCTYTEHSVAWLFEQMQEKWGDENFHAIRICSADGECAGIFVYVEHERVGHTHLLLSRPSEAGAILDFSLAYAAARGLRAVRGRFQPVMLEAMKHTGMPFSLSGHGLLTYAREQSLSLSILAGKALFTGLTGEWPMHF
jgi:GNAT superfamily N-acetyltransferase